jgi:hypothetical protein
MPVFDVAAICIMYPIIHGSTGEKLYTHKQSEVNTKVHKFWTQTTSNNLNYSSTVTVSAHFIKNPQSNLCCGLHTRHDITSHCVKCACGNWWQCSQDVTSFPVTHVHWLKLSYVVEVTLEINIYKFSVPCWEHIKQVGHCLRFWFKSVLIWWQFSCIMKCLCFLGKKSI